MKHNLKTGLERCLHVFLWFWLAIPLAYCVGRVFFVDRFIIPSDSMMPELEPGDIIWAQKWSCGPRLYRSFDFAGPHPDSFRLPGMGKICVGDIAVFNTPVSPLHGDSVWFTINDVCCKRLVGAPGDRIGAVDGHVWNDRILRPLGSYEMQEMLRWTWDGLYIMTDRFNVFPRTGNGWTIKNWGPLVVPAKGMTVELEDRSMRELYRSSIEYEMQDTLDSGVSSYTFTHDWYFFLGDNATVSQDSRYFGFVPDDFLIGIVIIGK